MTLQDAAQLPLNAPHLPPPPPWWPPAPGWWLLAVAALLLAAGVCAALWLRRRRARRRAAAAALFDDAVANAGGAAARIAAMSELLRRASRRVDADADRLDGEDWLRFLDRGDKSSAFATGPGRLLLDGAFRRDVRDAQVAALAGIARARFIDWMLRRPKGAAGRGAR